jgi:hypothetical protein
MNICLTFVFFVAFSPGAIHTCFMMRPEYDNEKPHSTGSYRGSFRGSYNRPFYYCRPFRGKIRPNYMRQQGSQLRYFNNKYRKPIEHGSRSRSRSRERSRSRSSSSDLNIPRMVCLIILFVTIHCRQTVIAVKIIPMNLPSQHVNAVLDLHL